MYITRQNTTKNLTSNSEEKNHSDKKKKQRWLDCFWNRIEHFCSNCLIFKKKIIRKLNSMHTNTNKLSHFSLHRSQYLFQWNTFDFFRLIFDTERNITKSNWIFKPKYHYWNQFINSTWIILFQSWKMSIWIANNRTKQTFASSSFNFSKQYKTSNITHSYITHSCSLSYTRTSKSKKIHRFHVARQMLHASLYRILSFVSVR